MGKTPFHGTDFTAYISVSNMVGLVHYSGEPYKYLVQLPLRARRNWGVVEVMGKVRRIGAEIYMIMCPFFCTIMIVETKVNECIRNFKAVNVVFIVISTTCLLLLLIISSHLMPLLFPWNI